MSDEGRAELRRFASHLLDAFVKVVEDKFGPRPVTQRELLEASDAVEKSPGFGRLVDGVYQRLMDEMAQGAAKQRRGDPFRRLLVHPFTDAFTDELLSRDILPSYFSFLHLVMGDEMNTLSARCLEISKDAHKHDFFDWDIFYNDPQAKVVLWTVLARIAESFKRFDLRKDWFITLMQNKPQAVSIASNAFIPKPHDAGPTEASPFGNKEFALLFGRLFNPLRHLTPQDRMLFERSLGIAPEKALGALWKNLDELRI